MLRALGEDLEADRASLGARRRPAAPAAGEPPRLADALRAMDGDLVFGDGLADLDARMTRTVADRRAARAERSRLARLHRARARDAAARREGRAAAAAEAAQTAPAAAARDDPRLERYARMLKMHVPYGAVRAKMEADGRAAKESEIPNFKGSDLGRFPLVSVDFWTSDHLSERSRSVDVFSERACAEHAR